MSYTETKKKLPYYKKSNTRCRRTPGACLQSSEDQSGKYNQHHLCAITVFLSATCDAEVKSQMTPFPI